MEKLSTGEWPWREALGALVVLISRILTAPRTPWENDEFLFAEAVRKFDPSSYHPHPPGYPLFVLLGKAFNVVVHDPWRSLVVLSIVAAPIGFFAIARAFRNWIGDPDLAVCGALVYYFSAAMLVHGTLAMSDGTLIMFVALAFLAMSKPQDAEHERNAILIGVWTSAAIGCRPQMLESLGPALLVALWGMRTMRQRIACVAAFGFVSLMWFLPLLDAAGGVTALIAYETKQVAYFASHDAAMSRGATSIVQIVVRFVFHPWGSKYITLPLFLCIILGLGSFAALLRRPRDHDDAGASARRISLLALIVFTVAKIVLEIGWMDPADAARYGLPPMILFALVAALGFGVIRRSSQLRATPWIIAALFAAGSWWYAEPILGVRTSQPSPVAAAAAYANQHFPANSVILYDLSLRPHAEYLMSKFRTMPIEKGLDGFYDRPDVPLVLFVNGAGVDIEGQTFSWPESDAYGKLTRNLYRQVSFDPVEPGERFLPGSGVFALERTTAGDEWRWLSRDATIRLPRQHGPTVRMSFRLSSDTPYDADTVHIAVNGREAGSMIVRKDEAMPVTVPVPSDGSAVEIRMRSDQSFAPATVLHNQDPRILAVQLTHFDADARIVPVRNP